MYRNVDRNLAHVPGPGAYEERLAVAQQANVTFNRKMVNTNMSKTLVQDSPTRFKGGGRGK
jgi:hypothetical protein